MSVKEKIEKEARKNSLTIGCWDSKLEGLSEKELNKVLEAIEYQNDTDVVIKGIPCVVEIDHSECEVDFKVLTKEEYINRYGNERYED